MDRTPVATTIRRLRRELFATPPLDGLVSIVLIAVLLAAATAFLRWAFLQAEWAVVQANSTLFAVGRYPLEQQWRLWLLTALRRWIPLLWPALYLLGMVLISGGLGLIQVSPSEWGGLLLTLVQPSFAILLCFPPRHPAGPGPPQ